MSHTGVLSVAGSSVKLTPPRDPRWSLSTTPPPLPSYTHILPEDKPPSPPPPLPDNKMRQDAAMASQKGGFPERSQDVARLSTIGAVQALSVRDGGVRLAEYAREVRTLKTWTWRDMRRLGCQKIREVKMWTHDVVERSQNSVGTLKHPRSNMYETLHVHVMCAKRHVSRPEKLKKKSPASTAGSGATACTCGHMGYGFRV